MRRLARSRSRSSGLATGGLLHLIIVLLVVLILLNITNLYLDHFSSGKSSALADSKSALKQEKTAKDPAKPPGDSLITTSASLVEVPLEKPAPVPPITSQMPEPGQIHIQVLNGCGAADLAKTTLKALRQRGFDVLAAADAKSHDYSKTLVIARSETPFSELAAKLVANSLGISADQISIEKDPNLVDTDVTLILGKDYKSLKLKAE